MGRLNVAFALSEPSSKKGFGVLMSLLSLTMELLLYKGSMGTDTRTREHLRGKCGTKEMPKGGWRLEVGQSSLQILRTRLRASDVGAGLSSCCVCRRELIGDSWRTMIVVCGTSKEMEPRPT
ncbi:hypothetical protein E2542_SST17824 [Spatholobus suberectus]|nr:hypothetical protein E2542_SST17824 [Spatholobus suberectus]